MEDKIMATYEFQLNVEQKAFEKDGKLYTYYDMYIMAFGVRVPLEPKDKNKVSVELIKQKCKAMDEKNKGGTK